MNQAMIVSKNAFDTCLTIVTNLQDNAYLEDVDIEDLFRTMLMGILAKLAFVNSYVSPMEVEFFNYVLEFLRWLNHLLLPARAQYLCGKVHRLGFVLH